MTWNRFKSTPKYGNRSTTCELHGSHRSALERSVCALLQIRMKSGEFTEVLGEVHTSICGPEGHECSHKSRVQSVVDFKCIRPDGSALYAEAKGMETTDWRIKLRLWRHNRPERLEIWMGSAARPILKEVVNED
jgi:hypothetical protein